MIVRSVYDLPADHPNPPSEPPEPAPREHEHELGDGEFIMPGTFLPPRMIVRARKPPDIIPGMCFESSVGMLVAPPYVGKTLLLMDLSIALATGQPWLKWRPSRLVPAIVFALDSPGWESREQAECLMAGRNVTPADQPFFLVTREDAERMRPCDHAGDSIPGALPLGPFNIMDDRWFRHIVTVTRGAGAKLIGLDSFSKIHTLEENDRLEMEGVMKQISRLAMETHAHVMLLHHTPVAERYGSVYAGRGSGAITASVDFAASIIKTSARECQFTVLKGRGSDDEGEFHIEKVRVDGTPCSRAVKWEVVPGPEAKPKAREVAWEWFQDALANGPLTRTELGERALEDGFDAPGGRKVDNYISSLRNSGLLVSPTRGRYALANKQ